MSWGSALGEIRTDTVLRINERGEWTELGEISIGTQPRRNSGNSPYNRTGSWS